MKTIKRFDPSPTYSCHDDASIEMEEFIHGDYVRWDDVEPIIEALRQIAGYDKNSRYGTGVCPYGCDTPWIAKKALGIDCECAEEIHP